MENRPKSCNRVSITTSKYHPIRKQPAFTPLAPSVTCGDSSLPEGAMGFCLSTLACCFEGSANCESLSRLRCQLPLTREPWGAVENKGPVVLLAAVVKLRLFRCKLRFHEMPRQDFPAGVCQLFLLLFPKGTKKNRENRDRIRHRPGLFTARFKG